jgi:HD superfamily phosphohydrolase
MEIRDPVHGSIHINDEIIPVLKHNFFQRLRNIKQLGFSEYVFPGATHTRYLHSIGVMEVGNKVFKKLFKNELQNLNLVPEFERLLETFKMACLLHDIGHAPLSHSTETVMPEISKLKLPSPFKEILNLDPKRQASHEDYTIKAIVDSSFSESFSLLRAKYGVEKNQIAELVIGQTSKPEYFTIAGKNYFPVLHQLISSELDCDRMDYLLRDSYFCGVSYGHYDLDWMLDNLCLSPDEKGNVYLGLSERAVVTFDDFLLSRYHMFIMVYFHYRAVCLEQLLYRFFETSPAEYSIPADIEQYVEHDDHYLMKVLRNSKNRFAQAIVSNTIPTKIYESFNDGQLAKLNLLQRYMESKGIEFIRGSSQSRLSKYYGKEMRPEIKYPIKVVRSEFNSPLKSSTSIDDATDLFKKFSQSHHINRLHCSLEQLSPDLRNDILEYIKKL